MTEVEKALAAELCVGISRRLRAIFGDDIHHSGTTDFQAAMRVLWAQGVATDTEAGLYCPQDDDGRGVPGGVWPDRDEVIREKLAGPVRPYAPCMDNMLAGYLGVATDYADKSDWLPATRVAFHAPEQYDRELAALAAAGYLERRADKVQWTKKAEPAMLASCCWDRDG